MREFFIRHLTKWIPLFYFLTGLVFLRLHRPFFMSRIDPEYLHLFNGMNCAILNFNRIGHYDQPGTPFQILTGIFIRITELLVGEGRLIEDVIKNPEKYLMGCSVLLLVLFSYVIFRLGKSLQDDGRPVSEILGLQMAIFAFPILHELPFRYTTDRMLTLVMLLLIMVVWRFIYRPGYHESKFAMVSGMLVGLGIMVKFTFLPFAILPFLLISVWKERLRYALSVGVTVSLLIIPIHKRLPKIWVFIRDLLTHDGLYGEGDSTLLNTSQFVANMKGLISEHLTAMLLAILVLGIMVIARGRHNKLALQHRFVLVGVLTTIVTILILAKHYKTYYTMPLLLLITSTYWAGMGRFRDRDQIRKILSALYFVIVAYNMVVTAYSNRDLSKTNAHYHRMHDFMKEETRGGYILIEPTWLSAPYPGNAIVFGMSYVHHHNQYYNTLHNIHPNLINWEGPDRPLMYCRMVEVDQETFFRSGKNIYVLSTPGRQAEALGAYIISHGEKAGVTFEMDTVYQDVEIDHFLIRYQPVASWREVYDIHFDFESTSDSTVFSMDGSWQMTGPMHRIRKTPADGMYSLYLDDDMRRSPSFTLPRLHDGDYLVIEGQRWRSHNKKKGSFYLFNSRNEIIQEAQYVDRVSKKWELMRMIRVIDSETDTDLFIRYDFPGTLGMGVDALSVKVYRKDRQ